MPDLKRTDERCPHCGYSGLDAQYRGRRLLAESCPDCGHVWSYTVKRLPVRP
jgi:DNA-directed RNA polymerase subunit RPC12/RpoP